VIPHSDDHDPIQGSIGLSVASPIEAMAVRFALEAGTGQTPQSWRKRLGTDAFGIVADEDEHLGGGPCGDPWASSMAGTQEAVNASRSASWALISASSVSQRRAIARKAPFAEAVTERIGPGRAAKWRISAILPMIRSSAWRKAAGALMMMVLSVTMACVRLFTAVSRATFRCRIISTELSADLGRAFA